MAEVVWTGPAVEDLRRVHEFIARSSQQYGRLTVERIISSIARLGNFPKVGALSQNFLLVRTERSWLGNTASYTVILRTRILCMSWL